MYILSTQKYVYSISKIRVNQLVVSRSIYFNMTLTGFSTLLQVHVTAHVWFLNLSVISHYSREYLTEYESEPATGMKTLENKWTASWENQQSGCAPSEDQPGHPPSLIRVFTVCMKKAWFLSYLMSAQRRLCSDWADAQADLSRLGGCPGWSESSLGVQSFCWFCHEVAQIKLLPTLIVDSCWRKHIRTSWSLLPGGYIVQTLVGPSARQNSICSITHIVV